MGLRTSVLLFVFLLVMYEAPARALEPPPEVRVAAVRDLPELLAAIPRSSLDRFGFDSVEQTFRCEPDAFLPLLMLPPAAVDAAAAGSPPVYDDPRIWLAVIMADEAPRGVLTVAWHRDAWRAVDLGAHGLAVALHAALATSPSPDPAVVQVLQAGAAFLLPDRADAALLAPLAGTGALVDRTDGSPVDDCAGMMRLLRPLVAANLESFAAPDER